MQDLKNILYQHCLHFIERRVETAKAALEQAQEASNDDTKSSAGDKYETGRAMMQQEIDRNKKLLMDAEYQLFQLQAINPAEVIDVARNGCLLYTSEGNFYISISAGLLSLEEGNFYAVSPVSPIGKVLLGKRKDDSFAFNGKNYRVLKVE